MSDTAIKSDLCHNLKIKKGLDINIEGDPVQEIKDSPAIKTVALLGNDYPFMKPAFLVQEGDTVKLGQPLFTDRKRPDIQYTSPGAGKVVAINRGERRTFQSIVIELSGSAEVTFDKFSADKLGSLGKETATKNLIASGLWTSIRNRPFSYVAKPEETPRAIFVTATDTNPHAPNPEVIISERAEEFQNGIQVLTNLTEGPVYVARAAGSSISIPSNVGEIQVSGPHPAGNVGTHIHFVSPAGRDRNVWHVNYQDVIAIGHLFTTGKILTDRVVSVAGPASTNPALVRTRIGASTTETAAGRVSEGDIRVVSGSLLSGHTAAGPLAYLGRFHHQVSVVAEGRKREFMGWMAPGFNKFSVKPVFLSALFPNKKFKFDTDLNGSHRAIVPVGSYEKVMPLDILPTFLLRALIMKNIIWAEELGILELDEEDLSLCTFVSPGKEDYGVLLRENLIQIEKEG